MYFMPLSGSLYMIHFMFCEFQLNGKKKSENLDSAGREAVEGVLWGENNGVCKNGQASQICTFRELCCLVSDTSSGSRKSESPGIQRVSWAPCGSTSNPYRASLLPVTRALSASHAGRPCVSDGNVPGQRSPGHP